MKKRVTRKPSEVTLLVYTFKKEVDCFAFITLHTHIEKTVSDNISDYGEFRR